jgi:hypothetical protein
MQTLMQHGKIVLSSMQVTVERLLADIRTLAPDIAARAAEIEAARRIPRDLVETLRSIGLFRMFVPRSHGGLELDLPLALEVITALGKIDGSVGWTAMIGNGGAFSRLCCNATSTIRSTSTDRTRSWPVPYSLSEQPRRFAAAGGSTDVGLSQADVSTPTG